MFLFSRHPVRLSSACVLLLCALALGCDLLGNQTDQANRLVAEMNGLVVKGDGLARQGAAKQDEMESKDIEKERDAVRAIAREQASLYKQGAEAMREAAAKAEQASQLKVADWYKNYLSLKAQQHRKSAEVLDAAIERAELLASDQSLDEIDEKMAHTVERIAKLSKEEEELVKQAQQVEAEHKADFTQ